MHTACVWCGTFVYCLQVPLFPEPGAVNLMRQYRKRIYSNADHISNLWSTNQDWIGRDQD